MNHCYCPPLVLKKIHLIAVFHILLNDQSRSEGGHVADDEKHTATSSSDEDELTTIPVPISILQSQSHITPTKLSKKVT